MNRDRITRDDFPAGADGYDRPSVDAHLTAVAAWTAALEAQVDALEVERAALRDQVGRIVTAEVESNPAPEPGSAPEPVEAEPDPEPAAPEPAASSRAEADSGPARSGGEDEVSARLVATRLALEGSEREEIVSRLTGEYELDDPDGLVEDVLSRL
jgi:hypothetical protein